jgi:CRP-like cAMP-binding protein
MGFLLGDQFSHATLPRSGTKDLRRSSKPKISSYPPAVRRQLLSKHFVFSTMPEWMLDDFVQFTIVARFQPDQLIFSKGDAGDFFYVILSGRVRIFLTSPDGDEIDLNVMEPGEHFGESALVGNARTTSAAAMEPTELLGIHRDHFRGHFKANSPDLIEGLLGLFCQFDAAKTDPDEFERLLPGYLRKIKTETELRSIQLEVDNGENIGKAQRLSRSIEFQPEHRQAGIGILNYFSKFLTERYPDVSVKVIIEQEGNKVRMIIETTDGCIEIVEQTLEEYALIISGKASPSDFLSNQYQIMELNQKLEMAAMEIRWQNRFITALEHDKNTQREFFIKQIEYLNQSVALGMANSSNLIKALDDVIQRPAVDPSISSAIERISLCLREIAT